MEYASPQLLSGLVDKYRRLLHLRSVSHAEPPRTELRHLARQFPGSLRELDRLPLASIEARLHALERVLADGAEPEPWMRLQVSYHGLMRATLRVKRWSRSLPDEPAAALTALAARYVPAADEPALDFFGAETLQAIRRPPSGRLQPLVLAAVARLHGTTPELVESTLFLNPHWDTG
ncbi:MAG TPA: hypothetical protein VJR89_19600 [Polyangiales bacterium]|nr:hypothetical protein [Polyangiales bacterium]